VAAPGHTIELLEDFPCATGEDLRRREGHHIRENAGRALNKNIAGRTAAEYMTEHAEDYRRRANEWYKNNRERRKAYESQTREYRLAWMRNYYQTVVKPRKDALRSASEVPDTSTTSTATEGLAGALAAWEAAATLKPASVAAESVAGV
jgi:hypothetical protein